MMDSMDLAFYNLKFDHEFDSKKANEFQLFFSNIMEARYPGDFIPTRPWGQEGDQKCDGYILSTSTFYQVYAPDELEATAAVKKMRVDFAGALEKWKDKIKVWVFVHNAKRGVPPHIIQQLRDFQEANKSIKFEQIGKQELKTILFEMSDDCIRRLLGAIPTYQDINNLSMDAIRQTLLGLSKREESTTAAIVPVSDKKLEANGLSKDSKTLFQTGMIKSNLINDFFKHWHDPGLEGKAAAEMNSIYKTAVKECQDPDCIFKRILTTIGGTDLGNPSSTLSALTIMAYFFQTCDIFEQPRGEDKT